MKAQSIAPAQAENAPGLNTVPPEPMPFSQYVLGVGDKGFDRLVVSEEAYGYATGQLVERLKQQKPAAWPSPPLRMAVVAVGAGTQLSSLRSLSGPKSELFCSDISEEQIAIAQRIASQRGLTDVHFETLDIERHRTAETFDVVHARFVLVHLKNPLQALRNMWSMVREQGLLLSEEHAIDGIGSDPSLPAIDTAKQWLTSLGKKRGVDFNLGQKLSSLFLQAGIPRPESYEQHVGYREGRPKRLLEMSLREAGHNYVEAGIASKDDLSHTCNHLRLFAEQRDTTIYLGFFCQAWANKTRSGS